jgi:hypothetical protein
VVLEKQILKKLLNAMIHSDTTPRASKYIDECPKPIKLMQFEVFEFGDEKGCFYCWSTWNR